jgi:hypothetical protein
VTPPPLSPAENVRRRRLAADHGPGIEAELRARLPGLPLEIEVEAATLPVGDEDAHVYVKTDGTAVLRVLGVANDLTRQLEGQAGVRFVARVWPRTIWCRKSARRQPREHVGPDPPPTEGLVYSQRDSKGNTCLCLAGSHAGEHDFAED